MEKKKRKEEKKPQKKPKETPEKIKRKQLEEKNYKRTMHYLGSMPCRGLDNRGANDRG